MRKGYGDAGHAVTCSGALSRRFLAADVIRASALPSERQRARRERIGALRQRVYEDNRAAAARDARACIEKERHGRGEGTPA